MQREKTANDCKYLFLLSITFVLLYSTLFFFHLDTEASARKITYKNRVIATVDSGGLMTFKPSGKDDAPALEYLLNNDKKKRIVFPKGKTIRIGQVVDIGSNTMINATGATIIQTDGSKGVIKHKVDGTNYNAIHNVTIVGGTWRNKTNAAACTMVRFAHGRTLKFKNMKVITNYNGHALELIACKDVKVYNCTLVAENSRTKSSTSVEDALQIDVATPKTAPGVYKETNYQKKYVNGQTCQNIRVEHCKIYGSRGICANYARSESKFHNKYHKNIIIYDCNVTGTSAQGIALYNTIGATVKANTVKCTSKRIGTSYTTGIHLHLFGAGSGGKNLIYSNKVYAYEKGIYLNTVKSSSYFGTTRISNNKIYVKRGYYILAKKCRSLSEKSNKKYKW